MLWITRNSQGCNRTALVKPHRNRTSELPERATPHTKTPPEGGAWNELALLTHPGSLHIADLPFPIHEPVGIDVAIVRLKGLPLVCPRHPRPAAKQGAFPVNADIEILNGIGIDYQIGRDDLREKQGSIRYFPGLPDVSEIGSHVVRNSLEVLMDDRLVPQIRLGFQDGSDRRVRFSLLLRRTPQEMTKHKH